MMAGFVVMALSGGVLHRAGGTLFIIAGTIWAHMEVTDGVNTFRKALGWAAFVGIGIVLFFSFSLQRWY